MPDVGVLNLKISDDSKEAAGGLDQLVSKLKSLSKIASTKNEGLTNVAQHIRDIVNATKVDDAKLATSMKNIAMLINSFSGLTKLNGISKLNVKPIKDLKTVIGSGFNIGQAGTQINRIREALTGEWNTDNARTARDSMKAIATGAEALDKSKAATTIGKVAESLEKYNSALSAQKAVESETKEALGRYTGEPTKSGLLSLNLQQFGRKKGGMSEGQMKMDLDAVGKWTEGFTEIKTVVETAKEPVAEFNETIKETASITKDTNLKEFMVDPVTQLMDRFRNCADASETFGRSFDTAAYSTNLMKSEAIIASKNVEMLKNRLETPIKWRGLNEMVNHLNGVGRGFLSAKESADVFVNTPVGETAKDLHGVEEIVRNIAAHETDIAGVAKACTEIMGSGETSKGPNLDFSVFDPSKLPLDALGVKLDESSQNWYKFGDAAKETFEIVKNSGALDTVKGSIQEVGETVNAIIPYNENLENTWERIVERIDEANKRAEEARAIRERQEREFYANSGPKDVAYTTTIAESLTQLDLLEAKLREAQDAYNDLFNKEGPGSSKTIKKGLEVQKAEEDIERFVASMENAKSRLSNIDISPRMSITETNDIAQGITELDMYRAKFEDAQYTYNRLVNEFGVGDARTMQAALSMQNLAKHVEELEAASASGQSAFSQLLSSMEEAIFGADRLRGALKKLFPTLSGMLSRFKNIAKYRFLRTVLKQITSGAKEGLENVYRYSQMVGTGFAPAMDSAASALAQMKNSVGAALSPALQALIPLLNQIVGAFINVINVANQFFALLGGQASWTRALPQAATAFDDIKKSAKGASGATKDLLADWDELNIIQSNGGGGGSGSGKDILDYENMFEQVSVFDDKIKGVVDTIKNGFGDVWGLAKEIALAVLAWKVSRTFGGFIGKFAKIIAGGVILDIGLKFSYGGAFSAGTKGFFDGTDFIEVVGGMIASGLGGALITSGIGLGSGVGFGVGITAAVLVTIVGYIAGRIDAKDKQKWGNISMTADQIRELVEGQFSFDVNAEIEVLHANVTRLDNARREVNTKINQFKNSLRNTQLKLTLGMDASADGANVAGAVQNALDAINAVKQQITETESAIEVAMKILPYENSEGKDVSDDILKNIKVADSTLFDYMNKLGQRLSEAMYEGEKAGWKNGTTEAAIELMRAQEDIYNEAERIRQQREFDEAMQDLFSGVEVKDGLLDRDSAMQAFEEQKRLLEEYRTAAIEEAKAEAEGLKWLGDLALSAANHELETGDKEGLYAGLKKASDDLYEAATLRLEEITEQTDRKLEETRATMRTMWMDLFGQVYGEDFEEGLLSFLATGGHKNEFDNSILDWLGDILGLNYGDFNHRIGKLLTKGLSPDEIADQIRDELKIAKDGSIMYNPYTSFLPTEAKEILDFFGIDAFDLYADDAKQAIMNALIEAIGGASPGDADQRLAAEVFKSLFSIDSWEEIAKYMPNGKVPEIEASFGFKPSVDIKPIAKEDLDIPEVTDIIENSYADATGAGAMPEVEVPTPITFSTDGLADALLEAYASNWITNDEIEDIIGQYNIPIGDIIKFVNGSDIFDDEYVRSEIVDALENFAAAQVDPNAVAKKFVRSGQIIGSAGFSDVGYNGYSNAETGVTREENKQDIAGGVAAGTESIASTLNAILLVAQAINRKDFSFTLAPTAAVGRGVVAGLGALAKVTGND